MVARIYSTEMLEKCINTPATKIFLAHGTSTFSIVPLSNGIDNIGICLCDGDHMTPTKVQDIDLVNNIVFAEFYHFAEDLPYDTYMRRYGYLRYIELEAIDNVMLEEHLAIQMGLDPHAESDNEDDWEEFWNAVIAIQPRDSSELEDIQFDIARIEMFDPFSTEWEDDLEDYII